MKKLIFLFFILLLIFLSILQAKKIGVLSDVLKPEAIAVSDRRLYVVEGANFFVYALPDLKLLSKFGKKGEGPGELKEVPMLPNNLEILTDNLFVDGIDKVLFFSKNRQFLKEIKKKYMTFKTVPIADHFVAMRMQPLDQNKFYFSVFLLDSEMKPLKELHKQEYRESDTDIDMVIDSIHFAVYRDKIFLEASNLGFLILVFDSEGNKLQEIRKDIKAPAITAEDRQLILDNLKEDNLVKMMVEREGGWNNFKNKMHFNYPDQYPSIQDLVVVDDKIYVTTFVRKDNRRKHIIMDLQGDILDSAWLPVAKESSYLCKAMGRENRFYGISDNIYYYLTENQESEEWEIHKTEIE